MKKKAKSLLEALPEEIIGKITSIMDVKSVMNCMLVCKQWFNLISDPCFVLGTDDVLLSSMSTCRSVFEVYDLDTLDITAKHPLLSKPGCTKHVTSTCNGLVCFLVSENLNVHITNPIIGGGQEYISVPRYRGYHCSRYNLGFCPSSNEYKLTLFGLEEAEKLNVYTLGSPAGWRSVPAPRLEGAAGFKAAIWHRGVFHWLVKTPSSYILTFDLAKEVFGSTPVPRVGADKKIYQLGYIDHCLAATAGYDVPYLDLEIWVRRKDESVWTMNWRIDATLSPLNLYNIRYFGRNFQVQRYCGKRMWWTPIKLSSDGHLFLKDHLSLLYSYHPRDRLINCYRTGCSTVAYTPTLLSPNKLFNKTSTGARGK